MLKSIGRGPKWLAFLNINKDRVIACRSTGLIAIILFSFGLLSVFYLKDSSVHDFNQIHSHINLRKLLSTNPNQTNASHAGLPWEGCDFESNNIPGIWVLIHVLLTLIIFVALAIVCDDFFVPSLEAISEKLKLSEDVAGATFMAAGSSAPELFASVASVAQETDAGVGTIVGSAVFNILIIIALTAALAGQVLNIDWRPLMRDSIFYGVSIVCFIGFSWDAKIEWWEALILLLLYVAYIIMMAFNTKIMDFLATCCVKQVKPSDEENKIEPSTHENQPNDNHENKTANGVVHEERKPSLGLGGHARRLSIISQRSNPDMNDKRHSTFRHHRGSIVGALMTQSVSKISAMPLGAVIQEEEDSETCTETEHPEVEKTTVSEEEDEPTINICPCVPCCPLIRTAAPDNEAYKTDGGCLNLAKLIFRWILFIPAFPFAVLFSWTIPECSKEKNRKWFLVSFFMSVVWIAALSFVLLIIVSRIGCLINIDLYTMGLIVIAIGTSIPDALSSILVAREGYGDMAVSNAIGSNVFDINLGLGLPFIINTAITGLPVYLLEKEEYSHFLAGEIPIVPHVKFGFILIFILIVTLLTFFFAKFKLNKKIGISFVIMYVLFLIYTYVQELYCSRKLKIVC